MTTAQLSIEYEAYLAAQGLPLEEAYELLHHDLTTEQSKWVWDFIARWDVAQKAEDRKVS